MRGRAFIFVATLIGTTCFWLAPAQAKVVYLGIIPRADLSAACAKAGGESYGTNDPTLEFGCKAHERGIISCSVQGACQLFVSDLVPVTGNSLATVLGLGPSQASIVMPTASRVIEPLQPSPKVRALKARSSTSPLMMIIPEQPSPVQVIPNASF